MGDSLENADSSVETQNVAIIDYGEFSNYLKKAATILLPEEDATAPELNIALDDKVNQDCIRKFLSDPQIPALYVQRICSKGKVDAIAEECHLSWFSHANLSFEFSHSMELFQCVEIISLLSICQCGVPPFNSHFLPFLLTQKKKTSKRRKEKKRNVPSFITSATMCSSRTRGWRH